jgi:hypothetical protein
MTKLDYSKVSEPDPARVIEVRDSGVWSGDDAKPFETEAQRLARRARESKVRAKENAALAARSEIIRYKAIIKKYGLERATELGVPAEFVAPIRRSEERLQRKRERRAARIKDKDQ